MGRIAFDQIVGAIGELPSQTNITELRQRLGMINYLGKFLPDFSTVMHPINCLLVSDKAWTWGEPQEEAFRQLKGKLTSAPVLKYYDETKLTVVSADEGSDGLAVAVYHKHSDGL